MNRRHLLAACAAALIVMSSPVAAAPAVEIVGAEFGIFEAGRNDEIVFQPTTVIPHAVGQRYGWIIDLRTTRRSLSVREEYVLPDKAPAGDAAGSVSLPDLRRSQVSQRQLVPHDGQIVGEWSVGPGEPAGRRRLQVFVEGQVAATFEFELR